MNPLQTGMFPQSQMDKTQFATPTQMPVSREIVSSDFDTQIDPYSGNLPRFKRGGDVGIKSLARDLPKYGRYGDDVVAHISSDEARMLQQMGGSGTINPVTGLPEYFIGSVAKAIAKPFKETYNATLRHIPGVDQALVGLDKTIGKTIPGGWGTVANVAGSAMGLPTPLLVGMGALTGSGALKPNGKFNLQGAIMGGAAAYGSAKLGDALRAAAGPAADVTATQVASDIGQNVAGGVSMAPGSQAAMLAEQASGLGTLGAQNIASSAAYNAPAQTFGQSLASGASNIAANAGNNLAATGQGIKNLSGFGTGASNAATAFGNSGATISNTAVPILAGTTGLAAIDEQNQAIKDNEAQNAAAQNQYNAEMAAITQGADRSKDIMRRNPYQFAGGGAIAFAPGGNVPRFLSGGGDGLSDDIPATIDGKQPARLADGEFVISSDVVSALGGGSSKAGAKKLYAMMDRIREQAHGTEKQVRRVNEKKVLPA